MGPKQVRLVDEYLDQLSADTMSYMAFQQMPESSKIFAGISEIEPPREYILLLKLRLHSGQSKEPDKNEGIPPLESGGYLDQPYLMSLCFESVLLAERKYARAQEKQRKAADGDK